MKFNWGTGIMLGAAGFVTFMSIMVYKCVQQDFDLVVEDYYSQELKYEEQVMRINNAGQLDRKMEIVYNAYEKEIRISYPADRHVVGTVQFYKPDHALSDRQYDADSGENGVQVFSSEGMQNGAWDVNVTWTENSIEYFHKERIFVNN